MVNIDILNDPQYMEYQEEFRKNKKQQYAATEIAYINRYMNGEKDSIIYGKDFSVKNFALFEYLLPITLKPMFERLQPVKAYDIQFKKEWTDGDTKKVNKALRGLFYMQHLTDHRGTTKTMYTIGDIEDFFGLPYTSSSSYAAVWNTNTQYYIDIDNQYNIDGFALTEDSNPVLIASDTNDNTKYFIIK